MMLSRLESFLPEGLCSNGSVLPSQVSFSDKCSSFLLTRWGGRGKRERVIRKCKLFGLLTGRAQSKRNRLLKVASLLGSYSCSFCCIPFVETLAEEGLDAAQQTKVLEDGLLGSRPSHSF